MQALKAFFKTALCFSVLVATPSSLLVVASTKRAQLGDFESQASNGIRPQVLETNQDVGGTRSFRKGCFHDIITDATQNSTNKFRLQEAGPRTSSPCDYPRLPRKSWIENPSCHSNPALELVADGCHIEQFDPHVMLRLLNNRTLYIIGDSLKAQMWHSLDGCLLAPFVTTSGPWLDLNDTERDQARAHKLSELFREKGESWWSYSPYFERIQEVPEELGGCQLEAHCSEYSDGTHSTKVCAHPQRMAVYPLEKQYAVCWKQMKETDIALVNFGIWANSAEHMAAGIQNFVSFVKNSRSSGSEVSDDDPSCSTTSNAS